MFLNRMTLSEYLFKMRYIKVDGQFLNKDKLIQNTYERITEDINSKHNGFCFILERVYNSSIRWDE